MRWLLLTALAATAPAMAADLDLDTAFTEAKKAKWDPKGKALDPYVQSKFKRRQEKWEEAAALLVTALDAQAGCGKCLRDISECLIGLDQPDDAVKATSLLTEYFGDRMDVWMTHYEALDANKDAEGALSAAKKAVEIDQKSMSAVRAVQSLLLKANSYDDARSELDNNGLSDEDKACLGVEIEAFAGEVDAAKEKFKACEENENSDLKREAEGWLKTAEGDTEAAQKLARDVGDTETSRMSQAIMRRKEGKHDQAVNLLTKAIEEAPEALDAHALLARVLYELDKKDEARAELADHVFADGWVDKHEAEEIEVILEAKGAEWIKDQTRGAASLMVTILVDADEADEAKTLLDAVVDLYGEDDATKAAASEIANAGKDEDESP